MTVLVRFMTVHVRTVRSMIAVALLHCRRYLHPGMAMRVLAFQVANAVSERDAQEQCQRESTPVVAMELDFGQKVTERDTQECSGG